MAQCPVCQTEYIEGQVKNCSTCGWDLSPYPLTLGQVPEAFLEKERAKIAWATQMWTHNQSQLSQLQLELKRATQERQQLQSQLEQSQQAQVQFQSQLDEIQSSLKQVLSDRQQLRAEFAQLNQGLSLTHKELSQVLSQEIKAAITQLVGQLSQVQTQVQQLHQEWQPLKSSHDVVSAQVSQIKDELTQLQSRSSGVDYRKLGDLLAAGKWQEADRETASVMLKVAGRESEGWLDREQIDNFPCEDLRIINQLWVEYSNGHFGFSVQKRIWLEEGGKKDSTTAERLGDRVGWRVKNSWIGSSSIRYSLDAPSGHLPRRFLGVWSGWGGDVGEMYVSSLASRAAKCSL